jgi:hypothetical protein
MSFDAAALRAPRLQRAFGYWQSKLAGRAMPARADLDPAEIPDLLPWVMLIDVLPGDFRYRLIGTEVRQVAHRDYTSERLLMLPGKGPGSVVWSNYEEVVRRKAPFSRAPPYVGPEPNFRDCENVLLPLSADGLAVNMIFQVVSFDRSKRPPRRGGHDLQQREIVTPRARAGNGE